MTKHGAFEMTSVTSFSGVRALAPEWAELHATSATTNPYTHPSWMLTWAEHFVAEGDLYVLTARRDGRLLGVAPLYWAHLGTRRRVAFRALHLLGNGRCAQFTEIPGVLAGRDEHRAVFKETVAFLQQEAPAWDWVKLTMDTQQGWFEPGWLTKSTKARSSFDVHHDTRACVLIDLPDSWEQFLAARKGNIRRAIRRDFSRLDQRVDDWSIDVVPAGADLTGALDRTIDLSRARSERTDKRRHPTVFGQKSAAPFYRDAVAAMTAAGQAEIIVLRAGGEIVAGLVALRANAQVFVHLMAADAKIWDIGAGTILISELARREIARGTAGVNLGAGPNQFKLGWSEHLEFNHDFVVVGPRARNRARYIVYSELSNLAALRRAGGYDTRDPA